jgi:hypothetical protein
VQRRVALKVVRAGFDSPRLLARFEQECQALALMDHPNIARVLDAGVADARPYFVMELIQGVPITQYCDTARLAPRQRLELFLSVCHAVQHAHQKGIIHRDLKPSNILVALYDGVPVVKVIDFGVAKATGPRLTEQSVSTEVGALIGTLEYMSPEQAELNNLDIDTRSDIYSLGVLLYELITGTVPFSRQELQAVAFTEMLRMIKEVDPPRPSTKLSDSATLPSVAAVRQSEPKKLMALIRGELDWIVMKCLEKDRARRYETANGLAMDLQRYLADEPVAAGPPSAGYRLRKLARKHCKLLGTAVAFALLLAVGTVLSTWQAVRATIAERATGEERDRAIAEKERGDEEAAIARAVDDFLQRDLLGQADIANQPPGARRNKDITVRELLDRASRGIDSRFRGQDKTEAAIRDTLGLAYRALGEYALAHKHLQRAMALRKEKLGAGHRLTLHSMNNLASLCWENGDRDKASRLYQAVLEGLSARLGSDHPDTLVVIQNLAMLDSGKARYDRAERRFKQVIAGFTAAFGSDHEKTLTSRSNLAALYEQRGWYDKAEQLGEQLVADYRRRFGADHPNTLHSMNGLATGYLLRKRYDKAEPLFEQVLKARRAQLPDGHPDTLTTMNHLAVVYLETSRYARAEPLFREALKASRVKPGPHHPLTLKIKNCLATLCHQRGYLKEAELLFNEVLKSRRARLEADHPDTLLSMHNLGLHYRGRRLYGNAEPLLVEAAAGARRKLTISHPETQRYINSLAMLHEMQGKPHLAEPLRRELTTFFRGRDGAESADYLLQLGRLSQNMLEQKKYAEAELALRDYLAIFDKKEPDAWTTYSARAYLGAALLGQKKYTDAERYLLQGYEGMKARQARIPSNGRFRLIQSLKWLVQLYDAWDRPDDAAKWRKELEAVQKQPRSSGR